MVAGRKNKDNKKDWNTPIKIIEIVKKFFDGKIELDPCSNNNSLVCAEHNFILPLNDGLIEDWNYKTIYINPPFGRDFSRKTRIYDWVIKSIKSNKLYNSEIILLIPVATNTEHFKEIFNIKKGAICFLYDKRLRFLDSSNNNKEDKKGSPVAICIIYIGEKYDKFKKTFEELGKIFIIKN